MPAAIRTWARRASQSRQENEVPCDASKARILRAAVRAFAADGFDGASIGQICDDAGVTRPTLYHFYGSKEGLLRAALADVASQLEASLIAALTESPSFELGCLRFVRDIFGFAAHKPDVVRLALSMTQMPSRSEYNLNNELAKSRNRVVERISDGATAGLAPPRRRAAHLFAPSFLGAIDSVLVSNLTTGRPALTPRLADALTEAVFSGWR